MPSIPRATRASNNPVSLVQVLAATLSCRMKGDWHNTGWVVGTPVDLGSVAQMGEHRSEKPGGTGSIPVGTTTPVGCSSPHRRYSYEQSRQSGHGIERVRH